jgi:hypothetical protein
MGNENSRIPIDQPRSAQEIFDALSVLPRQTRCCKCGMELLHIEATFLSEKGHVWTLPLPICPKCDLKEETSKVLSVAKDFRYAA